MLDFSLRDKQRRLLYFNVGYKLDEMLIEHMLFHSFKNFREIGQEYPFADLSGLKPGAKGSSLPEQEVTAHNDGLVIFYETLIPPKLRQHIEIESTNRVNKERLMQDKLVDVDFASSFEHPMTYVHHEAFSHTLERLSRTDYGLLIQLDPRSKNDHYRVSHYRVMVEWSMAAAATALAKRLGYVRRELHEGGEDKGLALKQKLFEYFGFHYTVGSRRRAAIRVAQLLKGTGREFAVYVGSAEARHLTKITEQGVERYALLELQPKHIEQAEKIDPEFRARYLFEEAVCLFRVVYRPNENSQPSKKFRKFDPKLQWLRIIHEAIMPLAEFPEVPPIPYYVVYGRKDPFEGAT